PHSGPGTGEPGAWAASSRSTSSASSPPTSTRVASSSWPSSPGRRPARSGEGSCGSGRPPARATSHDREDLMGGPKITVVAIVLLLVGLLTGYLYWGRSGKQLADELSAAKARLAEAQQAQAGEAAMKAKLDAAEAQLKQLTEQLAREREARQTLE